MSEAEIEFSGLAAHQEARAGLLTAAAGAADALENFQGGTEENESGDGKLLRQFSQDVARFSTPIVDAVTLEAALASHLLPIPVDIAALAAKSRFYLIRFPFELKPQGPWSFNELTVASNSRPFPAKQSPASIHFSERQVQADLGRQCVIVGRSRSQLGIFRRDWPACGGSCRRFGQSIGSVEGHAKAFAGLSVGPLGVIWKKALIKTSSTGLEWVWWELGGTTLKEDSDPGLMAVVRVPREVRTVSAFGKMKVRRYYPLFKQALKNLARLPAIHREFIEAGVPFEPLPVTWNLTKEMTS